MKPIRAFMLFAFGLLTVIPAFAQTGTVRGRVTEAGTTDPVVTAVVVMIHTGDQRMKGGYTDTQGAFVIEGVQPGEYTLSVSQVGFRKLTRERVTVAAGQSLTLNLEMEAQQIILDGVVVTASRQPQKVLEAPASVSVIDARQIAISPSLSATDHLRSTPGVDIARTGLIQQNVVVRGFNNVFSGTCMMMTDNRVAGVPSLRLNAPYLVPLPDEDIDYIEVVRGPGSALYGPNASNGVVNMITKSPFASPGSSISLMMGERSVFQGTVRHAGVLNSNVGYKISGLYFRGNEWETIDSVEYNTRKALVAAGAREDTLKVGKRDPIVERYGAEARLDFHLREGLTAIVNAGLSELTRGAEMTDIGSAQGRKWLYSFLQARVSYKNLFLQAFYNKSSAGDTYLLRSGNPIVDKSSQFVAQVQHSWRLGERQRFVYGGDYISTNPVTEGTITGRNENDDNTTEYGGYIQSETQLIPGSLDLVLAGRYDKHSELSDPVISPRAGLIWKVQSDQSIRLTYNRAYQTPATNDLFLDIIGHPNPFGYPSPYAIQLRASGVPTTGYRFTRDPGSGTPLFYSPFSPNPAAGIPVVGASLLWPAVVNILLAQGIDLRQIPSPQPGQIVAAMAMLNPEEGKFTPVSNVFDIDPLKQTTTETIELGFKGVLGSKMQVGIDLYRSKVQDFIGPFQNFTPNVFLVGPSVKAYLKPYIKGALMQQGVPEAQAEAMAEAQATQLGAAIGGIPLGTVTPNEAAIPTAMLLTPRNFGEVTINGADLWIEYRFDSRLSLTGSFSYVDKNFFENLDGVADLALNAPSTKGSIEANYHRPDLGWAFMGRFRHAAPFHMHSGVYDGNVGNGNMVDVSVSHNLRSVPGLGITVSAQNVFDKQHKHWIGAPAIGRMTLLKLSYTM